MRVRSLVALASLAIVSACGSTDSPVAPMREDMAPRGTRSSLLLGSPTTVSPLTRNAALGSPITVSKTIGVLGGTLSIPQAGVTIVVPPLAVSSPTTFSVTALAGSNVAYEFEPHGTRFTVPLTMIQSLSGTAAGTGGTLNPLSLYVGYFPSSSNVTSVTELLNVGVSVQNQIAVTLLWHFSGYIYAGGREADEL